MPKGPDKFPRFKQKDEQAQADRLALINETVEQYIKRRREEPDARGEDIHRDLTEAFDYKQLDEFQPFVDAAEKVISWERLVKKGRDPQRMYDEVTKNLSREELAEFHHVAFVAGHPEFAPDPEDEPAPPPAPPSTPPVTPPAAITPEPRQTKFEYRGFKMDATDPESVKIFEGTQLVGYVRHGGWIGGDHQRGDSRRPTDFGKEKAYWHSGAGKFMSEAEFQALERKNPRLPDATKPSPDKAQADAARMERERQTRERTFYTKHLEKLRAEKQRWNEKDAALEKQHALVENTMRASEVAQKVTPDIIRELGARIPGLAEAIGERSPDEVVPNVREAIRAFATADPEHLPGIVKGFEELKTYYEGPYKKEMAEVVKASRENGIDYKSFTNSLKSAPGSDRIQKLGKEIRQEYGFFKKVARILSLGLLFTGRKVAEALIRTYEPKYKAAENKMNRLSNEFGSQLNIDRAVRNPH